MLFQTDELNEFDVQYIRFLNHVRAAIQRTFSEEARDGLTQKELSETLGVDAALISRRLNGPGNITLKTLSELYTAMGRETLSNFEAPMSAYACGVAPAVTVFGDTFVLDSFRTAGGARTTAAGSATTLGTSMLAA